MIKAKTKISGGFRSSDGGECFANIRSLIGTAQKQGLNVYQTIFKLFNNQEVVLK